MAMNKVFIYSAAVSSVAAFGGVPLGATIQRRGLCTSYQATCPDGSCAWTAATCPGAAGGGSSSGAGYDYAKWRPTGSCEAEWATCSTTWQTETGGHQTQYSNYDDYYSSPYYSWDKSYANEDYQGFVKSSACAEDYTACSAAAADYTGWQDQAAAMQKYGSYSQYTQSGEYAGYAGSWTGYAAGAYSNYGDGGWGQYVKDYPAAQAQYGAEWSDYVTGANDKAYGDWRNYARAAGQFDSYEQYYLSGVYVPEKYTQYNGDWGRYVADYDGDITINGDQVSVSWSDYVDAANNKAYGDWSNYAKAAGKFDSYEQYYLPGVYVPKAYSEYGANAAGWSKYVKDYASEDNDWAGTSYPDGTSWEDYVNAANDKTASKEWRGYAKDAGKYSSYADYCADSQYC